jgi:hypothetical protein
MVRTSGGAPPLLLVPIIAALILLAVHTASAQEIGQFKRFTVSLNDSTISGNPFDVKLEARFRHVQTGRTVTAPGFHAGGTSYKIFFMPDQIGEWTYTTSSTDPDLNSRQGSFTCTESDLPGMLQPDGKWWRFGTNGHDFPVILPVGDWLKAKRSDDEIRRFVAWAKDVAGARAIALTLSYFTRTQEVVPYVKGREGVTFNTAYWDRLNKLFDAARDAGMGHYIRFYSDDEESPSKHNVRPQSTEEKRLLNYAIARFSAYPVVLWDTGIDIGEYRTNSWIEWFAGYMLANDPWKHPVGSRTSGGSGGVNPSKATYYSDGFNTLPARSSFVGTWKSRKTPTAMTDSWREDYYRGGFDRARIRRAVWEMGLTGGTAVMVSGNEFVGYLGSSYASDFKAAPDVGHAVRFLTTKVSSLRRLVPSDELVRSGKSVSMAADQGREYVAYLPSGGKVEIDLRSASGPFKVTRIDPLTGRDSYADSITAGRVVSFDIPSGEETVLHITRDQLVPDPKIVSTPVTKGRIGEPYSYDVDSPDTPDATFRLLHGPAGMTIDARTGIVSWVPSSEGAFDAEVAAETGQGMDTQAFTITVSAARGIDSGTGGEAPAPPSSPEPGSGEPVGTGSGGGGGCTMSPEPMFGIEWVLAAAGLILLIASRTRRAARERVRRK